MLSVVSICNMALSHMGQSRFISSLTESSVEAKVCNLHYENCLKGMLEEYPWQFAFVTSKLTRLSAEHPQWKYVYGMPSGCLKMRKVCSEDDMDGYGEPFTAGRSEYGKAVMTNVEDAWGAYTFYVSDPLEFPPLFAEAFSWRLAMVIAPAMTTGRTDLRKELAQYYMMALSEAKMSDANECFRTAPEWGMEYLKARGTTLGGITDESDAMESE